MSETGSTWPEQEIVSAWLQRYGIAVPFKQQLDLQEQLTKLRLTVLESVREELIREIADRLENRTVPDLPGWREAISSDIAYIRSIIYE